VYFVLVTKGEYTASRNILCVQSGEISHEIIVDLIGENDGSILIVTLPFNNVLTV
jgi:hypothetical protein